MADPTYGLTEEELRVCRAMNLAPSAFAATKQRRVDNQAHTAALTTQRKRGLSEVDLQIARRMNIDPIVMLAQRRAPEQLARCAQLRARMAASPLDLALEGPKPVTIPTGRAPTDAERYDLSEVEQDACRRAKLSFADYARAKRNGEMPLYDALPADVKELCDRMEMPRDQFAIWFWTAYLPNKSSYDQLERIAQVAR